MGIPKFYGSFIRNRYSGTNVLIRSLPENISSLSLDANSIFHEVAQIAFKDQSDEQLYFSLLSDRLIELIDLIKPKDLFILAVDGVAPMSKIIQQRQRRYKSTMKIGTIQFDSNAITPGTDFMVRLDSYLLDWIKNKLSKKYNFTIVYSSHLTPSEGEHKIMQYYRDLNNDGNHVIYGMDADLIVLSMISELENIFLVRQDIEDIVNIKQLRAVISNDMRGTFSKEAINDFALLSFFVGSDFLPVSPMFENLGNSLSMMVDVYSNLKLSLTQNGDLLYDNFHQFLTRVSKEEEIYLVRESRRDKKLGHQMMDNSYENGRFMYYKFKELWYSNEFENKNKKSKLIIGESINVARMCSDYISTLEWILTYYFKGNNYSDQIFYFRYNHSPLIRDVVKYIKGRKVRETFNLQFLSPVAQLICVIPPQSFSVLPDKLKRFINVTSCFKDMMPERFILDVDNKDFEWQGIPLLPYPDIKRINNCIGNLLRELTDELNTKDDYIFND